MLRVRVKKLTLCFTQRIQKEAIGLNFVGVNGSVAVLQRVNLRPPTRKSKRLIPILVVFCPIFNEKPTALSKLIAVIVAVEGMCAVLV